MTMLRPAILLFILLSLITGGLYPLMTTALGQWWFDEPGQRLADYPER